MLDRNLERMARLAYEGDDDASFSPLFLVLQTLRRYFLLACSQDDVVQAARRCALPLSSFADQLPEGHPLLGLLDEILEALEAVEGEPPTQTLQARLTGLEQRLVQYDLAGLHERIETQRDQARLLKALDVECSEDDLSTGHYRVIEGQLRRVFILEEPIEPLLERLEEELARVRKTLAEYDSTYLEGREWTVEVFLADRFLAEGLGLWLSGLERMLVACQGDDWESAFRCLKTLREGNRQLCKVDRLADLTRQARGPEG